MRARNCGLRETRTLQTLVYLLQNKQNFNDESATLKPYGRAVNILSLSNTIPSTIVVVSDYVSNKLNFPHFSFIQSWLTFLGTSRFIFPSLQLGHIHISVDKAAFSTLSEVKILLAFSKKVLRKNDYHNRGIKLTVTELKELRIQKRSTIRVYILYILF